MYLNLEIGFLLSDIFPVFLRKVMRKCYRNMSPGHLIKLNIHKMVCFDEQK